MDSNLNTERRQDGQRRNADGGPPAGVTERRINIERRLFDLDINDVETGSGKAKPPASSAAGVSLAASAP